MFLFPWMAFFTGFGKFFGDADDHPWGGEEY